MANRYVVIGLNGAEKNRLYSGEDKSAALAIFEREKSKNNYDTLNLGEGVPTQNGVQWNTIASFSSPITEEPSSRPSIVLAAVVLLGLQLAISCTVIVLIGLASVVLLRAFPSIFVILVLFAILCILLVQAIFIIKVAEGRNWARIVLAILYAGGLVLTLMGSNRLPAGYGTLSVANAIFEIVPIVLLFLGPSNRWFKEMSRAQA